MPEMSKDSLRTCLVTGQKLSPQQLVRFVITDGKLIFDSACARPQPGRGGYIENTPEAFEKLKNNPKLKGKISHFMKVGKFEIVE